MDQKYNEKSPNQYAMTWFELNDDDRRAILAETSARIGLPEYVIEKDWWVVQTLRLITRMPVAEQLVFKGGTSLSKAWKLIDRFSEDIDLAINREFFGFIGDISKTQVGKLRDASNHYLTGEFLEELIARFNDAGISNVQISIVDPESPDDDPVKIGVFYPSLVQYTEYIQPRVLLEIGSRSLMEPSTECAFRSMIGDTFPGNNFADSDINIRCVNPERTFLEKLFLLHEEHQRPRDKMKIENKSRHYYDLYRISKTEFADKAIEDRELFQTIVAHRERFTRLGGVDYASHFPPRLNPMPPADLMPIWERDYRAIQENMIASDDSIGFDELMKEIQMLVDRINALE